MMELAELRGYFDRMKAAEGEISDSIYGDVLQMVGLRPLEACIPATQLLIQKALDQGAEAAASRLQLAEDLAIWAPQGAWANQQLLCLAAGEIRFLLTLQMEAPGPGSSASLTAPKSITLARFWDEVPEAELASLAGQPLAQAELLARHAGRYSRAGFAKVAASTSMNGYQPSSCYRRRTSLPPFQEERGWNEVLGQRGGEATTAIEHFFPAFQRALVALGAEVVLEETLRSHAARVYDEPDFSDFDDAMAAREFVAALHKADGGWVGDHSRAGLRLMTVYAMQDQAPKALESLQRILLACEEHGHRDAGSAHEGNDLDNFTWRVPSRRPGLQMLVLEDQNQRTLVGIEPGDGADGQLMTVLDTFSPPGMEEEAEMSADRVDSLASYIGKRLPETAGRRPTLDEAIASLEAGERHPATLARFRIRDGHAELLDGFDGHIEAVRAWNGFFFNTQTVDCVMQEEYGVASPGMGAG